MRAKKLWRTLALVLARILFIVYIVFVPGCARESTMTSVVLYENKGASLIQYESLNEAGYYFLCKDGKVVFVRTNRALLRASIMQTIIIEKSSCQN